MDYSWAHLLILILLPTHGAVLLVSVFVLGGLVCSLFDRWGRGGSSVFVCELPFQIAESGISKK